MKWVTSYESAKACTGQARQGARALLAWALETCPDAFSLGIYNCRTIVGGSTTSVHGEGRAVDIGLPVGADGKGTPLGHRMVARLGGAGTRLGIQAIVYDRTVWSAKSPRGRRYLGVHPHYDHLHVELTRQAADLLTLATFRHVLGGSWMPDKLLYARHRSTEALFALAALNAATAAQCRGWAITTDPEQAKQALDAGVEVLEVGRTDDVPGATKVRGRDGLDTLRHLTTSL